MVSNRFNKLIKFSSSPYIDSQIRESLMKARAAEPKVFYRWFLTYRAEQVMDESNAPPMSNAAAADLLKSTKYDDPASIFNITGTIGVPPGVAPLPLGKFTVDGKHTYCYLSFRDMLLPRDFLYDEARADTGLTYLKTNPDTNLLPKFFLQLGQLCLSPMATATSAKASDFVVVVTPDRKVFALWNPDGTDPEFIPDDEINREAYKTRATSGKLPGFSASRTAISLSSNIDTLCQFDQASKVLIISASHFIAVPTGTTLRFGGMDRDGWVLLDKVSKAFAEWPRYAAPPAAASPPQA